MIKELELSEDQYVIVNSRETCNLVKGVWIYRECAYITIGSNTRI